MTIKRCPQCRKKYFYDVARCIFCFSDVVKEEEDTPLFRTTVVTEVKIPSLKDTETPYFVALGENEAGDFLFRKTLSLPEAQGSAAPPAGPAPLANLKIGVIGTGAMGEGIAHWIVQHGGRVVLVTRSAEKMGQITRNAEHYFQSLAAQDKIKGFLAHLTPTTDISLLHDADLVIESITEEPGPKQELFFRLDQACRPKTVLVTNTSSLVVKEISAKVQNPARIAGLHFFNPVRKMKLVEVVKTEFTSPETVNFLLDFCRQLNKKAVVVPDLPGFLVNRMLFLYLLEAGRLVEQGLAPADIDSSAQLGLNHPLGPLALMDMIGVDVVLHIGNNLYQQTGEERWKVPEIIKVMVAAGKLGKKTGEGFYRY